MATANITWALTEKRERESTANPEIDPCLRSWALYKEVGNWHLIFDKLFFFSAQILKKKI